MPFSRRSMLGYKHKQDRPTPVCLKWQKCSSTGSRTYFYQNVLKVLSGTGVSNQICLQKRSTAFQSIQILSLLSSLLKTTQVSVPWHAGWLKVKPTQFYHKMLTFKSARAKARPKNKEAKFSYVFNYMCPYLVHMHSQNKKNIHPVFILTPSVIKNTFLHHPWVA